MKDFIATVFSAGAIVFVVMALTLMLFNPFGANAQWTPMHQAALEISESYVTTVPKFTKVEPVRAPRIVPVTQPQAVVVYTIDNMTPISQLPQTVFYGSYNIPTQNRNVGTARDVRAPR